MSGQQGCTPPEDPLKLGELYLRVTQLRARKHLHLLRGAIHVNRRHLSWAAGKCGSSTEQRSNRASLPHDHAEEQWHPLSNPVCLTLSLEYQSNVAWSLCLREPPMKTRLSVLRMQRGVPRAGHRDWHHAIPPPQFLSSPLMWKPNSFGQKKVGGRTLLNYISCVSSVVWWIYLDDMLAYKRRIEIGLQCMCECVCVYMPHVEGKNYI